MDTIYITIFHYEDMPVQYTHIVFAVKNENLIQHFLIFLNILLKTVIVGTCRGDSKEYHLCFGAKI